MIPGIQYFVRQHIVYYYPKLDSFRLVSDGTNSTTQNITVNVTDVLRQHLTRLQPLAHQPPLVQLKTKQLLDL